MAGKPLTIGGTSYPTIGAAKDHFRSIRDHYRPGQTLSPEHFKEVATLFSEHEEYALRTQGKEVVAFEVGKAIGGTECFYAAYDNGEREDFSFQSTITHVANRPPRSA